MPIIKLSSNQVYQPQVLGLGEIYEKLSVEKKRGKLREKFPDGIMFLSSNRKHNGRGLTMSQLEKIVKNKRYEILDKGFVDIPLWQSKPRKMSNKNPLIDHQIILKFISPLFQLMVLFESLWGNEKRAHMIYVYGRKKR